jgi:hypothetical protein
MACKFNATTQKFCLHLSALVRVVRTTASTPAGLSFQAASAVGRCIHLRVFNLTTGKIAPFAGAENRLAAGINPCEEDRPTPRLS